MENGIHDGQDGGKITNGQYFIKKDAQTDFSFLLTACAVFALFFFFFF